jgi:uncharacterized protein YndB with AHSA1/START domain
VDPVTASIVINRPREEVFDYLADIANHPEFTDHYLKDWHLTRIDSVGRGAGARFRVDSRFNRFGWADLTFVDVERPYRLVGVGRGGKFNRNKTTEIWTLDPAGAGATQVDYLVETEPALPTDRAFEALSFQRGWFKRNVRKALGRLQEILEDTEKAKRGPRATVGGL